MGCKELDTTEGLNRMELKWPRRIKKKCHMDITLYMNAFVKKTNEKIQKTYHLLNQKVYSLRPEYTYNLKKYFFRF